MHLGGVMNNRLGSPVNLKIRIPKARGAVIDCFSFGFTPIKSNYSNVRLKFYICI